MMFKLTIYKKSKIKLRSYKTPSDIWTYDEGYPKLKCMHRDEDCSNQCAFFHIKKWKPGNILYCDKDQLGVLA